MNNTELKRSALETGYPKYKKRKKQGADIQDAMIHDEANPVRLPCLDKEGVDVPSNADDDSISRRLADQNSNFVAKEARHAQHNVLKSSTKQKVSDADQAEDIGGELQPIIPGKVEVHPCPKITKKPGRSTMDGLDSSSKSLPEYVYVSWVNILVPNDPERNMGPWEKATLDTGASHSVIFKQRLLDLGLGDLCFYSKDLGTYTGISHHEIPCIGWVHISFIFDDAPDEMYEAKVDVLEDVPGREAPFSILLGREVISRYQLLVPDLKKMPRIQWIQKKCRFC